MELTSATLYRDRADADPHRAGAHPVGADRPARRHQGDDRRDHGRAARPRPDRGGRRAGRRRSRAGRRTGCCPILPARWRSRPRCTRTASPSPSSGLAGTSSRAAPRTARCRTTRAAAFASVAEAGAALLRASGRRCVGAAVGGADRRHPSRGHGRARPLRRLAGRRAGPRPLRRGGSPAMACATRAAGRSAARPSTTSTRSRSPSTGTAPGRDATHLLVVSAEHRGVGGALVQRRRALHGQRRPRHGGGSRERRPRGAVRACAATAAASAWRRDVERFLAEAGSRAVTGHARPRRGRRPAARRLPGRPARPRGRRRDRGAPRPWPGGPDQRGQPRPGAARRHVQGTARGRAGAAARGGRAPQPVGPTGRESPSSAAYWTTPR